MATCCENMPQADILIHQRHQLLKSLAQAVRLGLEYQTELHCTPPLHVAWV